MVADGTPVADIDATFNPTSDTSPVAGSLRITAESEAKKKDPLSNICACPAPVIIAADNGAAAEGREVDIVSEAFIREAALAFWTKKSVKKTKKIKTNNNLPK